jgi:hypothetical protein
MRNERIVAAAFLPHNAWASVALLDRWEEARPLLLAWLLLGAIGAVFAAAALAGAIEVGDTKRATVLADDSNPGGRDRSSLRRKSVPPENVAASAATPKKGLACG